MRKSFWNWILILVSLSILVFFLVAKEGVASMRQVFSFLQYGWLVLAVVFRVGAFCCEALSLTRIAREYSSVLSFPDAFRAVVRGIALGYVTPFGSGNFPTQVTILTRAGLRAGDASTVIMNRSVLYQFCYATVLIIAILYQRIHNLQLTPFLWIVIYAGFFVSLGLAALFIMVMRARSVLEFLATSVIRFLGRIRLIKEPDILILHVTQEIARMSSNISLRRIGRRTLLEGYLLGIGQIVFYNLITVCVYKALGLEGSSLLTILTLQSLTSLVQAAIPSPGGMGAAEAGFIFIMTPIMGDVVVFAMLLWRLLTYYLPIFLGILSLGIVRSHEARFSVE